MNKAYEVADRLMEWVSSLLHRITGEPSPVWDRIVYGILVFVIAIVVARILRMIVIYVIHRIIKYKGGDLLKGLVEAKVFTHITHVIPPLVILSLLPFAFHGTPELLRIIEKVCWIYLLGVLVFSINTQISVFWRIYSRRTAFRDRPMKGMIQIIKGLLIGIWVIIAVSILIERSPMALITGLGAFAAVLMLIFKDSILGFVAGVQLSQNDMIRNGDWIVVPGGAVNGVVIDVSLNTVKVQNFDNTIVTIPPYSLISGEVQNWRVCPIKPSVAYFRAYCKDRYILRKNTRFTFFKHSGVSPATDYTLKKYFLISLFIPHTSFNFAWCKFA